MPKTLVSLPQITPPPNINSNAALLTDISRFAALNPKERLALQVWLRAKELANDTTSPLTNYDPATASKVMALIQDANTVLGHIPVGDLAIASLAIDWANCKEVFASLSTDVDTLRNGSNMGLLSEMSNEDLQRAILYMRLEIGS
jgi:hypothetical protein